MTTGGAVWALYLEFSSVAFWFLQDIFHGVDGEFFLQVFSSERMRRMLFMAQILNRNFRLRYYIWVYSSNGCLVCSRVALDSASWMADTQKGGLAQRDIEQVRFVIFDFFPTYVLFYPFNVVNGPEYMALFENLKAMQRFPFQSFKLLYSNF